LDRIAVNLDPIGAVFEFVVLTRGFPRQLAGLANRHESDVEFHRDRESKNETTRLHARDLLDSTAGKGLRELCDRAANSVGIEQQRRDVAKLDTGLGVVRNRPNQPFDVHGLPPRAGCRANRTG